MGQDSGIQIGNAYSAASQLYGRCVIRDAIGNKVSEGSVLFMQKWGCVARVLRIHGGGLSLVSSDGHDRGVTQPVITISIDIPLDSSKVPPGEEPQLEGILCVRDPKSEELIEKMTRQ